jgi:hypothetical protein
MGHCVNLIHNSSLDFGAHVKRCAKIFQLCEYEGRGEVQLSVNICHADSARLYTQTHPPVTDAGLVGFDAGEQVRS